MQFILDMIIFLYREAYYSKEFDERGNAIVRDEQGLEVDSRLTEKIIAKHRNGSLCMIPYLFTGENFRFEEA